MSNKTLNSKSALIFLCSDAIQKLNLRVMGM